MRKAIFFSLLLIAFSLAACSPPPFSKHPLSQPGSPLQEERLTGVWITHDNGEPLFLHIGGREEGGMEALFTGPSSKGLGLITLKGVTTAIGDNHFVSVRDMREFRNGATGPPDDQTFPQDGLYLIMVYEVSPEGTLYFKMMSREYVKESIQSGRVAGERVEGEDSIILTDTPENLVRFVRESDGDQLFPETARIPDKGFFRKLIVPPPAAAETGSRPEEESSPSPQPE